MLTRREYLLRGVVQGVGFRPHVAVVASRHPITGFVGNDDRQVFIEAQGDAEVLDSFVAEVIATLPPLARVIATSQRTLEPCDETGFQIVASRRLPGVRTLIPPDVATCDDCLADMADPTNRRFGYAFTTCTNCGPRLTIIEDLPYDRPATTMRSFEMCPACAAEYTDPSDRRYHAQPISCFDCGPKLWIEAVGTDGFDTAATRPAQPAEALANAQPTTSTHTTDNPNTTHPTPNPNPGRLRSDKVASRNQSTQEQQAAVIAEARGRLHAGQILAVKGVGGFHLMCDARNADAVGRLRDRKRRSGKPFAVMVADVEAALQLADLSPDQLGQLTNPARPILIAPMASGYNLADAVAPGLSDVGVMLPYTPLHNLLLEPGLALVATSGNSSEEPLCYTNDDARARLAGFVDAFVLHDRDIHVPVEDSVMLALPGSDALPIRRSRGHAPLPVLLPGFDTAAARPAQPTEGNSNATQPAWPTGGSSTAAPTAVDSALGESPASLIAAVDTDSSHTVPTVLGVGGELKNTFAVAIDDLAFVSAHVGDMGSLASQQAFEASVQQLLSIHRREPEVVVCDLHPGYATTGWAERYADAHDVPLLRVQHHYAHALALLAEYGIASGPVVVAALDGTGYGSDGTIWGGEILTLGAGGASPAVWERSWHVPTFSLVGGDRAIKHPWRIAQGLAHSWGLDVSATPATTAAPEAELRLVTSQLASGTGVVATSSAGRLFDAAAAMLGLCQEATYEAQAAMALERAATGWARSHGWQLDRWAARDDASAQAALTKLRVPLADPRAAFGQLLTDTNTSVGERAWAFHLWLASAFTNELMAAAQAADTTTIGLTGGVVVNRIFTAALRGWLESFGYTVLTHRVVPPTDGGLSLGQAWAGRLLTP